MARLRLLEKNNLFMHLLEIYRLEMEKVLHLIVVGEMYLHQEKVGCRPEKLKLIKDLIGLEL
jgi:hypothetical protein